MLHTSIVTYFPIKLVMKIKKILKNYKIQSYGVKMEVFSENLSDLVAKAGISLRELARQSGVSAVQYSRYLKGSIPTIDITLKIAKYFECSLDFLFGLSNNKNDKHFSTYEYDFSKFLDNYKVLLQENNITHYKFMKASDYDESIIRHWRAGCTPRLDIIYYIAKNLNGSIDDLIGRY